MAIDLSNSKLTFDDEFNSFTSTPQGQGTWQSTLYGARTLSNNGEQQYYSDSTVGVNPFSVQNGELTITAAPGSNPDGLWYNSGAITTLGTFSQQYGYFEMRAELPQGAGMWPGFWLLPTDHSWPPEIDALEAFGAPNGGQGGSNLAHVNAISSVPGQSGGEWIAIPGDIYNGYHTYGVDWEADHITYYIDGAAVGQIATPDDMHKPMYMNANLAVGGNWVGSPAGETAQMKIDYIRAYSSSPWATAAAQQPISSPDGADTAPFANRGAAPGSDQLVLHVSEDAYNGDAQFTVTVDGKQVGGIQTATASHSAGQWQDITLTGAFGSGPHTVAVNFLNDAWAPTAQVGKYAGDDRNLYVQSITLNGETVAGTSAENHADGGGWGPAYDANAAVLIADGSILLHTQGTGTTPPVTPPPIGSDAGTGSSTVILHVSEDAWNGDAQFVVLVDGQQLGGTQTATANHSAGQWQDVTVNGSFDSGPHTVSVQFINDAWGGWSGADRNLYVQSVDINGQHIAGNTATDTAAAGAESADPSAAVMMTNGTADFHSGSGTPTGSDVGTGSSAVTLHVSEDAWNGDAQFNVLVDGHQVGGTQTATANHSAGQWQDVTVNGSFDSGPHTVSVQYINDAWGGTSSTDRNLYVQSVDINGQHIAGNTATNTAAAGAESADPSAAVMMTDGTADFYSGSGTPTTGGTGSATSTLTLHVSEDAWNGDAQFNVLVDGHQVGGVQTATASHSAGQTQAITLTGDFGSTGPGQVSVQFVNDAWGGWSGADRNLYVQSLDVNGQHFAGNAASNTADGGIAWTDPGSAVMAVNGTATFDVHHSAPPEIMG
jgi:beta-glucanase (GH16 family)